MKEKGEMTFGERNNVIILKAKTSRTVAETFADNVTGNILSPTVRVTARDSISFSPAQILSLLIEESWLSILIVVFLFFTISICCTAHFFSVNYYLNSDMYACTVSPVQHHSPIGQIGNTADISYFKIGKIA